MQNSACLYFQDKAFPAAEIAADDFQIPDNTYQQKVLTFARNWLRGTLHFSTKTSGSTGKPKIITHPRAAMEASAKATLEALQINQSDNALLCLSPDVVGGKMMIVRALVKGLSLYCIPPNANPLQGDFPPAPLHFVAMVPMQLQQILEETPEALEKLKEAKGLILGGAPVSPSLEKRIQESIPFPVFHTFGMTETISHIALRKLNGASPEKAYAAMPGVHFSQDESDCLVIHAPHITGKEALKTHDLITLQDEKHFVWLGRKEMVVNSGGIKLLIEPLEQQIAALLPDGFPFFLFKMSDSVLGEKLIMITNEKNFPDKLSQKLKAALPKYHAPREYFTGVPFLKSASGKILREKSLKEAGIIS